MKLSRFEQQFPFKISLRKINETPWLIYFLVKGENIVYVGKSSESGLSGRLSSHKAEKDFDRFFIIDNIESEAKALKIETGFICLLKPAYNVQSTEIDIPAINSLMEFINTYGSINKAIQKEIKKEFNDWRDKVGQQDLDTPEGKMYKKIGNLRRHVAMYKKRALDGTLTARGWDTLAKKEAELHDLRLQRKKKTKP
jgi:hypothetical protein